MGPRRAQHRGEQHGRGEARVQGCEAGAEAVGALDGSGGGDAGWGRVGSFLGGGGVGGEGAEAHVTGSDRFWRQKGPQRPEWV